MKKLLLVLVSATIFFSCNKKDDNNNGSGNLSNDQFRIGATTFSANSVTSVSGLLAAVGTNGAMKGSISIVFNTSLFPTNNGTYKIVDNPDADDEIYITAGTNIGGTLTAYASTGNNTNFTADVTVNDNGKITIVLSDVWVKNGASNDSVKISANITQQ